MHSYVQSTVNLHRQMQEDNEMDMEEILGAKTRMNSSNGE